MGKRLGKRRHNQIIANIVIVAFILYQILLGVMIGLLWHTTSEPPVVVTAPVYLTPPVEITVDEPEPTRGAPARSAATIGEDLRTPSRVSPQELQNCLPDGFSGLAGTFAQAEAETGVNALFLVSVAALESGWGGSNLAQSHNNLFGWTDSTSPSGFRHFESKEACIMYVAERLAINYLSPDGKYFNGYTVQAVNQRYCSSESWADKVLYLMHELEDKYNGQAYI